MNKKKGQQSIIFANPPLIISTANIVGPMEGAGLLQQYFDYIMTDNLNNLSSWEQCESFMMEWAIRTAVYKGQITMDSIDCILAGDLLNQLMSTHFAIKKLHRPFLGLYGACSTMIESLLLCAMLLDGGFANQVVAATSSHHDAAERQYRFPSELGVQRPPSAQWTVTGAGAAVLATTGSGPHITIATIGKIIDYGIKDTNAMGAAMAPAAVDTLWQHFQDTGRGPADYDMIFTGDLGSVGKELVIQMMKEKGMDIQKNYQDCGCMIYRKKQDAHAGASGCASSAVVFCGYIYHMLMGTELKKILLIGTGSLHSTTSYQQKESIPGIAHAIAIEM